MSHAAPGPGLFAVTKVPAQSLFFFVSCGEVGQNLRVFSVFNGLDPGFLFGILLEGCFLRVFQGTFFGERSCPSRRLLSRAVVCRLVLWTVFFRFEVKGFWKETGRLGSCCCFGFAFLLLSVDLCLFVLLSTFL